MPSPVALGLPVDCEEKTGSAGATTGAGPRDVADVPSGDVRLDVLSELSTGSCSYSNGAMVGNVHVLSDTLQSEQTGRRSSH